jgi:hypothetical protein
MAYGLNKVKPTFVPLGDFNFEGLHYGPRTADCRPLIQLTHIGYKYHLEKERKWL